MRELVSIVINAHRVNPNLHRVLAEQVPRVPGGSKISKRRPRNSFVLVRGYLEAHRDEIDIADPNVAAFVCVTTVEALTHAQSFVDRTFSPRKGRRGSWTTSRDLWSGFCESVEFVSGYKSVDRSCSPHHTRAFAVRTAGLRRDCYSFEIPKGCICRAWYLPMNAALRSTGCGCYNGAMGTQGLSGRVGLSHGAAIALAMIALFTGVLRDRGSGNSPIAAGCSSSPPWSSSANPPVNGQRQPYRRRRTIGRLQPGQPAYVLLSGHTYLRASTWSAGLCAGGARTAARAYPGRLVPAVLYRVRGCSAIRRAGSGGVNARPSPPPTQQAYAPRPPSTYTPSQSLTLSRKVSRPIRRRRRSRTDQAAGAAELRAAHRLAELRRAANKAGSYAAPAARLGMPPAQQDYSDALPYPKQSLAPGLPRLDANAGLKVRTLKAQLKSSPRSIPRPTASAQHLQTAVRLTRTLAARRAWPTTRDAMAVTATAALPPANPDQLYLPALDPKQSLFEVFSTS